MRKVAAPGNTPPVFAIPEQAHFSLVRVNCFLRLMAQLTETGSDASRYDVRLRPDALGWCFASLSREIDAIVGATYFSDAVANAATGAGTRRRRAAPRSTSSKG